MSAFGPTLRTLRRRAGLSQEGLAARAGVSARAVSDLERGVHKQARRESVERLADALGLEPSERGHFELLARGPGSASALPADLAARRRVELVGRADELQDLSAAALGDTARLRTVAIHGDAGIGKSRLVAELAAAAVEQGRLVLHASIEAGPQGTLQPLVGVVHQALRAIGREPSAVGSLGLLVPELDRALGPSPGPGAVAGAVNAVLAEAFAGRAGLLVADDVALAGPDLWSWLRQALATLADLPVTLVLVGRTGSPGPAARRAEAQLDRLERLTDVQRIRIGGLDAGAGTDLACRHGLPRRVGRRIHETAAGNPLAISVLARHLDRAGREDRDRMLVAADPWIDAPAEVDELVGVDLDLLPAGSQAVLGAAAVLGIGFTTPSLARMLEVPDEDLDDDLDRAEAIGVVEPDPGSVALSWRFTHPALRALVYGRVGPARRARLHGRAADLCWPAGQPCPTGSVLDVTAEHLVRSWREGEPTERIFEATAAAGRRAASLHAWEAAASWWDHAARAAGPAERPAALLELGVHRVRSLQRHLARPVLVDAARLAAEVGDADTVASAADWYARMTKAGEVDPVGTAVWRSALERWGDDHRLRVAASSALAIDHHLTGDFDAALALADDLDRAPPGRDPEPVGLITKAMVLWSTHRTPERLELADRLLASVATDGDLALEGLELKAVPLLQSGDRHGFASILHELEERGVADDNLLARAQAEQWRGALALADGDLEAAGRHADHVLDLAGDAPNFAEGWAAQQAVIARAQGRQETFLDRLLELAPRRPAWAALGAAVTAELGDHDTARRLVAGLFEDGRDRVGWTWTRVVSLALCAEAVWRTGPSEVGAEVSPTIRRALDPYAGQLVVVASGTSCEGPVDAYRALLARADGEDETAAVLFDRARALAVRASAPALVRRVEAWAAG